MSLDHGVYTLGFLVDTYRGMGWWLWGGLSVDLHSAADSASLVVEGRYSNSTYRVLDSLNASRFERIFGLVSW